MTDFTTITACGEYCVGCSKNKDGSCPGCIESDGRVPEWAGSGMCKVHACCKEHNARFCGLCSEFPCDKLPQMISWNPEIIKHLSALRDEYICSSLCGKYTIRRLSEADIPKVLSFCKKNTLYYQHCPPFVSEQSIRDDMNALPPGKTMTDKYYVGYYDEDRLIAVMDLIIGFPNKMTAFIGFFMIEADAQKNGLGSTLITELCNAMSCIGIKEVRLASLNSTLIPAKPLDNGFVGIIYMKTGRFWGDFYYSFQTVLRISHSKSKKLLEYLTIS